MELCARVAEITNESFTTIYKRWPAVRVHQAEIEWYARAGYRCAKAGSQSGGLQTTI